MVMAHDTSNHDGVTRRTTDIATDSEVTFSSMLLAPRTIAGLTAAGFTRPSPVQLQGIPAGKCGFNLLMEAKSGTGKTAVFAVIALDLLDAQNDAQVLILAPTREIAAQITDVIRLIGSKYKGLKVEVVMGGLPVSEDINKFANKRKVHIIVGSPGRLRHLIEDNHINTNSVRLFVLDEADKLMEGSFKTDINYIFSSLPNCKQVIMSSATYPKDLKDLVVKYMNKYVHVCPNSTSILLGIEQRMTVVKNHSNIITQTQLRYNELIKIFKSRQFKQCLIFCNYQARVIEICKKLKVDKWPAHFLHGKQEQTDRLNALKTLQDYKCRILVSTDLAARGIDASNVDLVVNFEIPYDWTTYLHRIGRAGRYGSYGMAISIVAQGKEEAHFKHLLKSIGAPVNIKTLWTEEPFELDDNGICDSEIKHNGISGEDVEENVLKIVDDPEKLWEIINKDDSEVIVDDTLVLEDFDNLNASYNKAQCPTNSNNGIETFERLMTSFDQSKSETINIPFKTFNVNVKSLAQCTGKKVGCEDLETIYNGEIKILEVNGVSCKSQNHKDANSIFNSSKDIKEKSQSFIKKEENFNNTYVSESDDSEFYNHDRQFNDKIPYYKIHESFQTNPKHSSREDSSTESDISQTESEDGSSDTEYDSEDENYECVGLNPTVNNIMRNSYHHSSKEYVLWLKQLAARRAQIQMAVYIEELGKMNKR